MRLRNIVTLVVVGAAGVGLTGCTSYNESHLHNAAQPAATSDVHATWVRIQSPGNYSTIIRTCVDGDGIYIPHGQDLAVTVVPNDPACKRRGDGA